MYLCGGWLFKLCGDVDVAGDLDLVRVLVRTVGPAVEHAAVRRHCRQFHLRPGEELALVRHLRQLHAFHQHRSASARTDAHVRFAREPEVVAHLLPECLRAVLREPQDVSAFRGPVVLRLVARPALRVTLPFGTRQHRQELLHARLHLLVGEVVVQQNASLVHEQALEIGVFQQLLQHVADSRIATAAEAANHAATAAEAANHAAALLTALLTALAALHGSAAQHPLEHVLAFGIESHNARRESVTVVHVENHELERNAGIRAAPGAYIVVRPVTVMDIHLGNHVLREAAHVHLLLDFGVARVVFAREVAARNGIHQLAEFRARSPVGAAGSPSANASLVAVGAILHHVDGLRIDAVVRLHETAVQALAQVVNAEVFAVVEHHHHQAPLVIHVGAFHQAHQHRVAKVVRPEAVAVVAQVEALDLLRFGACGKERIFQHLVAVVVVVHLDGDALLGFVTAVVTDNRDARVDFPSLFGGGAALFEVFHMHGEFVVFPEVRLPARFGALRVVRIVAADVKIHAAAPLALAALVQVAGSVQARAGVEHIVMIHGERHHRNRDVLVNEVRLRRGVHRLAVHEFATADHGILRNLLGRGNLFGILGGEGAVERTLDLPALARSRRVDGEALVEARLRQEGLLGLVVVVVFLEPARRGLPDKGDAGGGSRSGTARVRRAVSLSVRSSAAVAARRIAVRAAALRVHRAGTARNGSARIAGRNNFASQGVYIRLLL